MDAASTDISCTVWQWWLNNAEICFRLSGSGGIDEGGFTPDENIWEPLL